MSVRSTRLTSNLSSSVTRRTSFASVRDNHRVQSPNDNPMRLPGPNPSAQLEDVPLWQRGQENSLGQAEAPDANTRLALHIEPVESYRLRFELPWSALAFAFSLPLFAIGILGATVYWSDVLVVILMLAGIATLLGGLRLAAMQESRRNELARQAYAALPSELLAQATMSSGLSERTRTLIANLLTRRDPSWLHEINSEDVEWDALNRAGPPGCGGGCRGPVPPKGGFRATPVPPQGFTPGGCGPNKDCG